MALVLKGILLPSYLNHLDHVFPGYPDNLQKRKGPSLLLVVNLVVEFYAYLSLLLLMTSQVRSSYRAGELFVQNFVRRKKAELAPTLQ